MLFLHDHQNTASVYEELQLGLMVVVKCRTQEVGPNHDAFAK